MKNKEAERSEGALFFCGIGIERPSDASLRTIQLLKTCDVVFYIHGDGVKLKPFFDSFCSDVRVYAGTEFEGMDDKRKIEFVGEAVCAELRRHRRVAYVTYGHPVLFSDGFNMAEYCRERGFSGRFVPATSSVDSIIALLTESVDLRMFNYGYQICLADRIIELPRFDKPHTTLILFGLDRIVRRGDFPRLCKRLQSRYPRSHPVHGLRCGENLEPEARLTGRVGELQDWGDRVVHMMSLVLPFRRRPS